MRVYDLLSVRLLAKCALGGEDGAGVSALRWVGVDGGGGGGKGLVVGDEVGRLVVAQFREGATQAEAARQAPAKAGLLAEVERVASGLGGRVAAIDVCPSDASRFFALVQSARGECVSPWFSLTRIEDRLGLMRASSSLITQLAQKFVLPPSVYTYV